MESGLNDDAKHRKQKKVDRPEINEIVNGMAQILKSARSEPEYEKLKSECKATMKMWPDAIRQTMYQMLKDKGIEL